MWHSIPESELLQKLNSNLETGLSQAQVAANLQQYGYNELKKPQSRSLLMLILDQFKDLMVIILLVAVVVSTIIAIIDQQQEGLSGFVEPLVIIIILICNATVGVWQESNAEAALEALKDLQPEYARVLRSGEWKTMLSRELVPGDIIDIQAGNKIPADVRILKLLTPSLRLNQSSLTGEPDAIDKYPGILQDQEAILQDKFNIGFGSSTTSSGHALGVVVATGMKSEIGIIAQTVNQAQEQESQTPLQQKLDEFGNLLAWIIFAICALVWIMNFRNFFDQAHGSPINGAIYYFKIAIALAVAAVPEGLPAVITTCLALGTRRMAKRNAIVRKLPSVETLGCTTIICSDKTGTLTTNQMTVTQFIVQGENGEFDKFFVEGTSFEPEGKINGQSSFNYSASVEELVHCASLNNNSRLEVDKGRTISVGAPTEAALLVLCEKIGKNTNQSKGTGLLQFCKKIESESNIERVVTLEFTSQRKMMSVIVKGDRYHNNHQYTKGSAQAIIQNSNYLLLANGERVPFEEDKKRQMLEAVHDMGANTLRCIGLAMKDDCQNLSDYNGPDHPAHQLLKDHQNFAALENNLVFIGLIGMRDPPRPEVKQAIQICRQAGIRVYMITGDNQITATAIAKNIGIIHQGQQYVSFTGSQFKKLSKKQAIERLKNTQVCIFSRSEPQHKQKLVKILKGLNQVVAMTGDGVNDAPALQEAQIGVAMGIAGTEVAKRASDMVLADDKFSTIVNAVEEGRSIYNNTKAFIRYMVSSNIGEVVSIFLTAMIGVPQAFTSVQLLWVNLVTDGPPATALGFNPPDLDIMMKPPRDNEEPLITSWVFFRYLIIGIYVGAATVGIFIYWYVYYQADDGHPLISFYHLRNWSECPGWQDFKLPDWNGINLSANPCLYFSLGKVKACTLSLSVLVTIEMLNSLNALSEDCSLLQMPPWVNPWLLLAIASSILMHCVILYVPFFNQVFGITSLTQYQWAIVFLFSSPVILIDEVLKMFGRYSTNKRLKMIKKITQGWNLIKFVYQPNLSIGIIRAKFSGKLPLMLSFQVIATRPIVPPFKKKLRRDNKQTKWTTPLDQEASKASPENPQQISQIKSTIKVMIISKITFIRSV